MARSTQQQLTRRAARASATAIRDLDIAQQRVLRQARRVRRIGSAPSVWRRVVSSDAAPLAIAGLGSVIARSVERSGERSGFITRSQERSMRRRNLVGNAVSLGVGVAAGGVMMSRRRGARSRSVRGGPFDEAMPSPDSDAPVEAPDGEVAHRSS